MTALLPPFSLNFPRFLTITANIPPHIVSQMLDFSFPTSTLTEEQQVQVDKLRTKLTHAQIEKCVDDYYYLQERGWYMRNHQLQQKLLSVIRKGMGSSVNVCAPDLAEHLDALLEQFAEKLKQLEYAITDFYYLRERSWFMQNPELQDLLMNVIHGGIGHLVVVTSPDFKQHLIELLSC